MAECVLCGTTIGRNTQSREHIFAKWIRDMFPADPATDGRTKQTRKTQMRGSAIEVEEWQDIPLNLSVKNLCKPCNNEWCDQMDNEAQPILEPMIRGQRTTLDATKQMIVTTWATKTLLMFQQTHKDNRRAIPAHEFRWFREHRWPLENEQMWLGVYDGTGEWPVLYEHYGFELFDPALGPPVDSPDVVHGYVVAFSVGHLLFRAFGHVVKDGPRVMPGGSFAGVLSQIWPASGANVTWPPPITVSGDEGVHAIIAVFDDSFRRDG
jgi:hypothetical protein